MKSILISSIVIIFFSISTHAKTNMTDTSINLMKINGEFENLSACTGLSISELEQAMRGAFDTCFVTSSIQDDTTEECTQEELIKRTGTTEEQLEACKPLEERINKSLDQIQEQLVLLEDIQYELQQIAFTDKQKKELKKIDNKIELLYDKQAQLNKERDQLNKNNSVDDSD